VADRTWTILDLIQWTTGYFKDKAVDSPRAAAEILLAHTLRLQRIQLYLNYDKPLNPPELARYRNYIKRRAAGEPIQYITGEQEFWSHTFTVTPAVLIPRPETELLVEEGARPLRELPQPRALEIGTGSGAIAFSLAGEVPDLFIVATDISLDALRVAGENRKQMSLTDRVPLVACDLFSALDPRAGFDLIVSNPPYVSEEEYRATPREVREHEPAHALLGGEDGLDIVRRIMMSAADYLRPGGSLLLEIGATQGKAALEFAGGLGVYESLEVLRDYAGRERIFKARKR